MAKRLLAQRNRAAIWVVRVVVALSLLYTLAACAPGQDVQYFEETGHNVSGAFLRFFSEHGGLSTFGYPLTREFEKDGRIVQCFQRLCLQKPSPGADASTVEIAMLGEELEYRQSPIAASEIPPPAHPDKRYYEETGHTIGFAFLEFFDSSGGRQIFGYPITERVIEPSGRIVQYFERSKMEWYPENPPGLRVRLGMLGTIYVEQLVDPAATQREPSLIISRTPTTADPQSMEASSVPTDLSGLQVMATLEHQIIGLDSEQRVYVYVVDQTNQGVPGASVEMEVRYDDGRTEHISLAATNADGYSEVDFAVGNPTPGRAVLVDLSARYGELLAQSSTSFLPWW